MKLRHVLLTALSCVVLVGAAGNAQNGGMNGGSGGTDTGMNGGTDGNMNRGMNDSMMIMGTIESVDTTDSMFVVRSDTATDTVYYNQQTTMKIMKNKFVKGSKVFVKYTTVDGKKTATAVFAGKKNKPENKSNKPDTTKPDSSTSPGGPSGGSKEY
jgi:hypothetical protein